MPRNKPTQESLLIGFISSGKFWSRILDIGCSQAKTGSRENRLPVNSIAEKSAGLMHLTKRKTKGDHWPTPTPSWQHAGAVEPRRGRAEGSYRRRSRAYH